MNVVSLAVVAAAVCTAVLGLVLAPWITTLSSLWPCMVAIVFAAIAWVVFGPEPDADADDDDADADAEDDS